MEVAGPGYPAQAYHAARTLAEREAAAFIEAWRDAAVARAKRDLQAVAATGERAGHEPTACGILGERRDLPPLVAILRSHPMLHAAEGRLAREAVAEAAAALGVVTFDVTTRSAGDACVATKIPAIGKEAGPPRAADDKGAARAALRAFELIPAQ